MHADAADCVPASVYPADAGFTRRRGRAALALVHAIAWLAIAFAAALQPTAAFARGPAGTLSDVAWRELPREARDVYDRILAGGPFQYDRDGVVFGNREGILPAKKRGYYHEYTVRTPGERTRGARRIVCGGPKREPDACYYTDDHYQSFRRIRP